MSEVKKGSEYTVFEVNWYVNEKIGKSFEGDTFVSAYDLQEAVNYFKECHPKRIPTAVRITNQTILPARS